MSKRVVFPARYEPRSALGKGGGGEVWAVHDRLTGKTVALKALAAESDHREVEALVREAVALSGLEGLGVPRVLRFGRLPESGRSFLVRELVDGESLADLIAKTERERGAASVVLEAIAQAADQLTHLHRALLLHGDVKPANVIVGPDGRATLVDLGLAATWREGGARAVGLTPKYAAPELFEGRPLTVRAEVFALGATLAEALRHLGDRLDKGELDALKSIAKRATSPEPSERFPSADELASALRRAAGLAEAAAREEAPRAWPVVGVDEQAAKLREEIASLAKGGGLVVTGPRGAGKSTILRRVAWSLGVEGRAVAWLEGGLEIGLAEALAIELAGHRPEDTIVIVDDAHRLDAHELAALAKLRDEGARLVLGSDGGASELPGATFGIFQLAPLPSDVAGGLVARTIPSLSEAVVAHVVARASGWPGKLRAIVERIARAPVVSPADVDRLLEDEGAPDTSRAQINRLLDRGHYDEAAELLDKYKSDASPAIGIARARLMANRGDPGGALLELARVEVAVRESGNLELEATWLLNAARAHLRGGDYADAERRARTAEERLGLVLPDPRAADSKTLIEGRVGEARRVIGAVPFALRPIAAEAVVVRGLALSFAARHAEARETLQRASEIASALDEPRILSLALGSLAFALQRDEHLVEAKAAYEQALVAAERAGDAGSVATTRLNLAGIAKTQGDVAQALAHLEAAVDMGRRSGRVATLRQALLNLANLDLYVGRVARARVSLDALQREGKDLPPQQHAQLLALEAEHAARGGDLAAVDRFCRECAEAYELMGRNVDAAEARIERVLLLVGAATSSPAELAKDLAGAEALLGASSAHRAALAFARARVAAKAGRETEALGGFAEALEAARATGLRDLEWRVLDARADLDAQRGQPGGGGVDRASALTILEQIADKLPRDLREVFWSDPRRAAIKSAATHELASGATVIASGALGSPSLAGQERLARVLEINRAIAGEHDLARLLGKVTDHAIALLRAERGFVILRSGYARPRGAGETSSHHGTKSEPIPLEGEAPPPKTTSDELSIFASRAEEKDEPHARFSQSIAERVVRSGEPVVTASARDDARMADYVSVHQLMLQSVACAPIRARSGATIGALYLETRLRPAASFSDEMPTLLALADQVAIAIETARLVGENERRARELERTNAELRAARDKLEDLLGHRTAQLVQTKRDLKVTRAVLRSHFGYEGLVGTSEAMRRVYALIDRVKDTDVPLLIHGESGTGKEVVARAIHNAGPRAKKAFVGINCGAIPEHLLESELFGHVKGAFTGADRDRKGLFREATEGTILLDEIGEMPQKMQAGLLRVLQEKVVRPVGGAREEPVDTRVIAATHRDLAAMVEEHAFREDLFYRLNVIQVRVPPLRERTEDIPILIDHFLGIFAARYSRERRSVSRAALKRLLAYPWPGNVRQLENVLLNAWVLGEKDELEPEDFELPSAPLERSRLVAIGAPDASRALASGDKRPLTSLDAHRASERERILQALGACNWNRVKAAQMVGMPRRTFYRRLKEYGIQ